MRSVKFDLVIPTCQRDVFWHFWSIYFYNDKFIIYSSHVIENFEINLFNVYLRKKNVWPHALCIEKNIVFYVISFWEEWYGFRKPQCGDPEHRITLCEIYSIKTDNIDGYIIHVNVNISTCIWKLNNSTSTHLLHTSVLCLGSYKGEL